MDEAAPDDLVAPTLAARSRGALDREERAVKDEVLRMGSRVELQIATAIRAFVARDAALAETVIAGDEEINEQQRAVTDLITTTIATQAPVARDLRFLLALNHVASELERIGDHAVGVAKQVRRLPDGPPVPAAADLTRMGEAAATLVGAVLGALVNADGEAARAVAAGDDEIDHLYSRVFTTAVRDMQADPDAVERGTRTVLVAHWLERIGDRVTNIAEDVVHLATGRVEDLNP
ncbi:MAG TPA: phosphate signaling complex protein PhoU [Candidatus Sulfomarinibacteraceae bacterium]|nr:phosphate signaling complex protein PhoU [Candidatus Sulfomarinibacteraceae bacterium]